jgi:hypothetical protein
MSDQTGRYVRLRSAAMGAVAALAVVGAIAGTAALAAQPQSKAHRRPPATKVGTSAPATKAAMSAAAAKAAAAPSPCNTPPSAGMARAAGKPGPPPTAASDQPFLNATQQLVDSGAITAAEGQVVDGQIMSGSLETQALASSGFTQAQIKAVSQTLGNTKRSLAAPGAAPAK